MALCGALTVLTRARSFWLGHPKVMNPFASSGPRAGGAAATRRRSLRCDGRRNGRSFTVGMIVSGSALCVVVASGGYPESYGKGFPVSGVENADSMDNVKVFHAGTSRSGNDIVTAGGRVFGVTGWGGTFREARDRA